MSDEQAKWARKWATAGLFDLDDAVALKSLPEPLEELQEEVLRLEEQARRQAQQSRKKWNDEDKLHKLLSSASEDQFHQLGEIFEEMRWAPDSTTKYAHRQQKQIEVVTAEREEMQAKCRSLEISLSSAEEKVAAVQDELKAEKEFSAAREGSHKTALEEMQAKCRDLENSLSSAMNNFSLAKETVTIQKELLAARDESRKTAVEKMEAEKQSQLAEMAASHKKAFEAERTERTTLERDLLSANEKVTELQDGKKASEMAIEQSLLDEKTRAARRNWEMFWMTLQSRRRLQKQRVLLMALVLLRRHAARDVEKVEGWGMQSVMRMEEALTLARTYCEALEGDVENLKHEVTRLRRAGPA